VVVANCSTLCWETRIWASSRGQFRYRHQVVFFAFVPLLCVDIYSADQDIELGHENLSSGTDKVVNHSFESRILYRQHVNSSSLSLHLTPPLSEGQHLRFLKANLCLCTCPRRCGSPPRSGVVYGTNVVYSESLLKSVVFRSLTAGQSFILVFVCYD